MVRQVVIKWLNQFLPNPFGEPIQTPVQSVMICRKITVPVFQLFPEDIDLGVERLEVLGVLVPGGALQRRVAVMPGHAV